MPCQVILAPPATHLAVLQEMVGNNHVCLSAQNCFYESAGAYTGEISPSMIKSLGVDYVIIGHSERRQLFHETNEIIKKKIDAALAAGL